MSITDLLMAAACLLFMLAGVMTWIQGGGWRVSVALICIGLANALLLWEATA